MNSVSFVSFVTFDHSFVIIVVIVIVIVIVVTVKLKFSPPLVYTHNSAYGRRSSGALRQSDGGP